MTFARSSQEMLQAGYWDDGEFGDIPGVERVERPQKIRQKEAGTQGRALSGTDHFKPIDTLLLVAMPGAPSSFLIP